MTKVTHPTLHETTEVDRVLGRYSRNAAGPTVLFLCGTHGNETASVFAMKRVFAALERLQPELRGETMAAFAGNLRALREGVRYIDSDLNRGWIPRRLRNLGFLDAGDEVRGHEAKEQRELKAMLEQVIGRAQGEIFVLDLHTTSSESPPFCAISDTIRNRRVAVQFPLPCVVGFDEETKGTFLNYINELGITGVALESGQHDAVEAVDNCEAFVWLALGVLGCLDEDQIPDRDAHHARLAGYPLGRSRIFDLVHRHLIGPEDGFTMRPGYATFDEIAEGEHLADDRDGPVLAELPGRIFMPLYQKQGDDGYFIVQERDEAWLAESERLRAEGADTALLELPAVQKHPEDPYTIVVDMYAWRELRDRLHMLGFRRRRREGENYVITRRPYDVDAPELDELDVYQED